MGQKRVVKLKLGVGSKERCYTFDISWLPKQDINNNMNRHVNMEGGKSQRPHPWTKNHRQLRNAEKRRSFAQG